MSTVVIRYNAGNVLSVTHALHRLGVDPVYTDDPETIKSANHVIFPGVGEASTAMQYLRERELDRLIVSLDQPVLGVCLGLQLMCQHTEENDTPCMGIFDLDVRKFEPVLKVPHMGWNTIEMCSGPILGGLDGKFVYFVHSYYAQIGDDTSATTDYIVPFSAALSRDNFHAVQFHPEKSADVGASILKNFLTL